MDRQGAFRNIPRLREVGVSETPPDSCPKASGSPERDVTKSERVTIGEGKRVKREGRRERGSVQNLHTSQCAGKAGRRSLFRHAHAAVDEAARRAGARLAKRRRPFQGRAERRFDRCVSDDAGDEESVTLSGTALRRGRRA